MINTTLLLLVTFLLTIVMGVALLVTSRRMQQSRQQMAIVQAQLQAREAELQSLGEERERLEAARTELAESNTRLREQLSALQTELSHEKRSFSEKLGLLENAREQMSLQFKNLANEILEDKSKRFTATNKDNISQLLQPLQERISSFEKRVEETYDKESKERFSLAREIKSLQELNTRISEDAINLTNALKGDNKAQGTWGEMILESILAKSGLVKGREYEVQVSIKTEAGKRSQPDVVVHMPEAKDIIIDAKVSLKAYEAFCSEDRPDKKAELLRQHIQSIRNHVKSLAAKDYQNLTGPNSLDFILLFMPVEAAFSVAAQEDAELFMHAFERNIIIVGPSTLLTTLRTVQNIWRLAQQNKNALEIAAKAGALYDKFVAFVEDLEELGSRLQTTQRTYDKAKNKLVSGRGNLISRVEKLRVLGAKTSKRHNEEVLQSADLDMQQDALPEVPLGDKPGTSEPH